MKSLLMGLLLSVVAGCASKGVVDPYYDLSVEYLLNETKLTNLCNGNGCNDSSPYVANLELGVKFKSKTKTYRIGVRHSSKIDQGIPFNGMAEYYRNSVRFSVEGNLEFNRFLKQFGVID